MSFWTRSAAGVAIIALAFVSRPALADYTYTFNSAAIGTVAFSTPTLIAPNQSFSNYSITYLIGTAASGSFTQDLSFDLLSGQTSTGYSFDQYEFAFSSFPMGVGLYNAPNSGSTFTFYTPSSSPRSGNYTSGTLAIAFVPPITSVPEPMSLALLATGIGVATLLRRRR